MVLHRLGTVETVPKGQEMKLEIHIHIHGPSEPELVEEEPVEQGPMGAFAQVEHGDHDSTPRRIGFNADERNHDD